MTENFPFTRAKTSIWSCLYSDVCSYFLYFLRICVSVVFWSCWQHANTDIIHSKSIWCLWRQQFISSNEACCEVIREKCVLYVYILLSIFGINNISSEMLDNLTKKNVKHLGQHNAVLFNSSVLTPPMPVWLFIPRLCISKVCQSFFSRVTWGQWTLSADMFCSHNISYRCWSSISVQSVMLCPLPFSQVAGEVLAKANYTPVLSIIDSLKSFFVGQVHLQIKKEKQVQFILCFKFCFQMRIDHILHHVSSTSLNFTICHTRSD